jgi:hypothetical protein
MTPSSSYLRVFTSVKLMVDAYSRMVFPSSHQKYLWCTRSMWTLKGSLAGQIFSETISLMPVVSTAASIDPSKDRQDALSGGSLTSSIKTLQRREETLTNLRSWLVLYPISRMTCRSVSDRSVLFFQMQACPPPPLQLQVPSHLKYTLISRSSFRQPGFVAIGNHEIYGSILRKLIWHHRNTFCDKWRLRTPLLDQWRLRTPSSTNLRSSGAVW